MSVTFIPKNPDLTTLQICNGDFETLCQRGVFLAAGLLQVGGWSYFLDDETSITQLDVSARDAYAVLRAWQTYRRAVKDASVNRREWVHRLDQQLADNDYIGTFFARCGGFTLQ